MITKILLAVVTTAAIHISAQAAEPHAHHSADVNKSAKAAATAKVSILEPVNSATVPTTFTVKFGANGINIVPAGTQQENSGHHHLLVDVETLPDLHGPLPTTANIIHFGKGQTETQLTLAPGKHTLQLLVGNYAHIPGAAPVMSEKITVTVK